MTYKTKFATAIATGAVLLNALAPLALADTNLTISGNGSSSDSDVHVTSSNSTSVVQNNTANVTNTVNTTANTGNNRANDNTGGDVTVNTGAASSTVDLSTAVNRNEASVSGCGSCGTAGNTKVTISGNGSHSDNDVRLNNSGSTQVFQTNDAIINNNVDNRENTGNNDANRNTGGTVTVLTGNATSNTSIDNRANANVVMVGGNGNGTGGSLNAVISGNGSFSDNSISLRNDPAVTVVQDNNARITNRVTNDLRTGNNDANDNTGGDVTVYTGNANATTDIRNMANFNAAALDCGCLLGDVTAKISGNGSESDNDIDATLGGTFDVYQGGREGLGNIANLRNDVNNNNLKTGDNDANRNDAGARSGDPVDVFSGDASADTTISNHANENIFSQGGLSVGGMSLSFDLGDLLHFLHLG